LKVSGGNPEIWFVSVCGLVAGKHTQFSAPKTGLGLVMKSSYIYFISQNRYQKKLLAFLGPGRELGVPLFLTGLTGKSGDGR